jgi:hypothetical protein
MAVSGLVPNAPRGRMPGEAAASGWLACCTLALTPRPARRPRDRKNPVADDVLELRELEGTANEVATTLCYCWVSIHTGLTYHRPRH